MNKKLTKIPQIQIEELNELEGLLWSLLREREEFIGELKDEIARLKGEKGRPKIKPSRLEPSGKSSQEEKENNQETSENQEKKKRPGSNKRRKTTKLKIHETVIVQPRELPPNSEFKGYQDYTIQELIIKPHNIRYRLAVWKTPSGETLRGELAGELREQGHFGKMLKTYILYQYYHCHVTQPLLLEQLREWEIDISAGQLSKIIVEEKEKYHQEKQEILRVGLLVSSYINTDDTGARHQGKNSYCTQIGNDWFAWFETTSKKNRINFLKLLRGEKTEYILSSEALNYMKEQKLPKKKWHKLNLSVNRVFRDEEEWERYLKEIEITKSSHVKKATEGALLGTIISNGVSPELGIISDGAGQFRLLEHGLCWVHAERLINKLIPLTVEQKTAVELVQDQIWEFYQDLKRYKNLTTEEQNQEQARLSIRFDEIFNQSSCFESLDQVLARLKRRKAELLLVLEKPELPLHNNASEQDIREFVKKRKISGSTRSEDGRRCRDTFASLKKTCRKLGVSFWNYLRDRVSSKNQIPQLGQLIEKKVRSQCPLAMQNFVSST
jgi:hypothetical protein